MRKVAIVGLGENEQVILKAAIETASGFATGLWQHANLDQEPEMIFLDPDTPEGESALNKYTDQEKAPVLVYCSEKLRKQNTLKVLSIQRPLSYANVVPVLRQADSLAGSHLDSSISDTMVEKKKKAYDSIEPTKVKKETQHESPITDERQNNAAQTSIFSGQGKTFHHLMSYLIEEKKAVEISHPDFPSIRICSEREWFIFSEDLSKYIPLFRTAAEEFTVIDMEGEIKKQAFSGHFPRPLWELVFTAKLLGSDAILTSTIEDKDLLYLSRLPDFDKIPHSAEHINIASYMGYLSANVTTIAEDLAIEKSVVIDFSNACHAIGLLVVSGEVAGKLIELIYAAIQEKKSVEISHPEFPAIQLYSNKDECFFPVTLEGNKELFRRGVSEFTVNDKTDEWQKKIHDSHSMKTISELIYTATLFSTEGKMLQPLRPEQRLSLSRKPDFKLLTHTKEHKIIATYMSNYSDPVCEISNNTRIDISVIIDFCNACESINILEKDSSHLFPLSSLETETTIESKIKHDDLSRSPGLLKKIFFKHER